MIFSVASTIIEPAKPRLIKQEQTFEPDNGKSYLGTPVYSYIEFPEGSYETLEGRQIDYDGIRINEVLIDVTMAKNIITTQIQGRNGTIKEYFSDGDYTITVTGKAINENNAFPEVALNALKEICKVPETLVINCPFLQYFGITAGVITDYSFTEVEGYRNRVDFTISLISDTPPVEQNYTTQSTPKQEGGTDSQTPPISI